MNGGAAGADTMMPAAAAHDERVPVATCDAIAPLHSHFAPHQDCCLQVDADAPGA